MTRPAAALTPARRIRLVVTPLGFAAIGVLQFAVGQRVPGAIIVLLSCFMATLSVRATRELTRPATALQPAAGESAVIRLERENVYRDGARAYDIVLDGARVGHIRAGERVSVPVRPGEHVVELRLGRARSEPLRARLADEETMRLVTGPSPGASFLSGIFGTPGYISLRPA